MPLSIKHPEADRLARALARTTGESLTDAVIGALRERLSRETGRAPQGIRQEVAGIQERLARLPVRDGRPPDAVLGYDADGLPR